MLLILKQPLIISAMPNIQRTEWRLCILIWKDWSQLPSHICEIFSLYTLFPWSSTKERRNCLNLFLISRRGACMDTHSRTECPFMSSRFSMLSMSYKEINENKKWVNFIIDRFIWNCWSCRFMISHRRWSEARLF